MIKVSNMVSSKGNTVPNQFIIDTNTGSIFQSYSTIIAKYINGNLILDTNAMNYSVTTSRYLYQFTLQNRKQMENGIDNGIIKVRDLNK